MVSSIESAIVRIYTADGDVVGAGFLVGARQILTCAHVIAGVLGLPDDTPEKPQTAVLLDFPLVAPGQLLTARVIFWHPPQADGGGDIAGLELNDDPPGGAQVAHLARVDDLWEHSFRAFGFPKGEETGVWATGRLLGRQVTKWVQIEDVKETGFPVEPGFSGTPVWDTQLEAVVGMVVAAERRMTAKTAFAIPVDVLVSIWSVIELLIRPFVFLCYARADSELVMRLRNDLATQGINIWIDREGLEPGSPDWEESLRKAIRAAQAVLLIASPNGRSSRFVKDELRLAEMYQRPVYPVWMAGTQWMDAIPIGWGGAQYIDARESHYETALHEIVTAMSGRSSAISADVALISESERSSEPRNPYKGLRAFTNEDARDFFGRETLIQALVEALQESLTKDVQGVQSARLLAVMGPSGSGKSSVLMAGLLPYLQQGGVPGSKDWVYLDPLVPGKHPLEALASTLKPHFPDTSFKTLREDLEDEASRGMHLLASHVVKRSETRVVLLVDQFEEVFTQTTSEEERRRFLDVLLTAITEPRGPLALLLTLRADFYGRLTQYPALALFIKDHHQLVLPMELQDLHAVIEKPAALPDVQLTFEGDLVGDLLFDLQGQAGALPLLQFTLDQLFQKRSGHLLTLAAYREMGGVKGALTSQAEATYAALPSEEHRRLARALFVRLIDPGMTEQDTTRRRAALSEFALTDATQTRLLQETVDAFIEARLLVTNEVAGVTTLEVSHEALIREWARLSAWLREAREDIRLQQAISEDVEAWVAREKPTDRLYRGTQLAEARAWAERNVPNVDEVAFLQASKAERQREEVEEQSRLKRELTLKRQTVNRLRIISVVLTLFLVASLVFAYLLQVEQKQTLMQLQQTKSRALAVNAEDALAGNKLDLSLLLSAEATRIASNYEARNSLLNALKQSSPIRTMLRKSHDASAVNMLAFNQDSPLLIASYITGISLWNTQTKKSLPLDFDSGNMGIGSATLSPKGQTLIASNGDGVWLVNIQGDNKTDQLGGKIPHPTGLIPHTSTAVSLDGRFVASARCSHYIAGNTTFPCTATHISIWDTLSKPFRSYVLTIPGDINSIALSSDGAMVAESNDTDIQLWSTQTRRLLHSLSTNKIGANSVAFSPDDKTLASGSKDGTVRLWDVASGLLSVPPLTDHKASVTGVAFSRGGQTLTSSSEDGTVMVWDLASKRLTTLNGDGQAKICVTFSADGETLASGSKNGTIILWNLGHSIKSPISQRVGDIAGIESALFTPDGTMILVGGEHGEVFIQDAKTGKSRATLSTKNYPLLNPKHTAGDNLLSIQTLALSKDGSILAVGREDGRIVIWSMRTKATPIVSFTYPNQLYKLSLSADGQRLAAGGIGAIIKIWDVTNKRELYTLSHPINSYAQIFPPIALSPDGKLLAAGGCGKVTTSHVCGQVQIQLWDMASGKLTGQLPLKNQADIADITFSPDGNTLASSSQEDIVLWSIATKQPSGQIPINTDTNYYHHLLFSPDGNMLATYNAESVPFSFVLWDITDVTSPQLFVDAFHEEEGSYQGSIAFTPNGQQLASVVVLASDEAVIILRDISIKKWQDLACSIANRDLDEKEWQRFVGDKVQEKVCSDLT